MNLTVDEDLIFLNKTFDSNTEALKFLSNELLKKGYVKDTFSEALLKRETVFPTGLDFKTYGVAIPHTDSEHVNKSILAMATLSKPVMFSNMEDENKLVKVNFICMIALKEKESQATFLSNLVGILADGKKMKEVITGNKDTIYKIFNNVMK